LCKKQKHQKNFDPQNLRIHLSTIRCKQQIVVNVDGCGFRAVEAAVRRLGLRHQAVAVKEGLKSTLDDPL